MKSFIAFSALCLLLAAAASAKNLARLETRTARASGAAMDFGDVDVEIINSAGGSCVITDLDSDGNNFQWGELDVFEGGDLEGCRNFPVPDGSTNQVIVSHKGPDGWICDYVRLVYDDHSSEKCPDGSEIDDYEQHTLDCQ